MIYSVKVIVVESVRYIMEGRGKGYLLSFAGGLILDAAQSLIKAILH